jgi:hypothetical protein
MRPKESTAALQRGRPGYHDPTTELGGTPAYSPLTLRLKLALFGLACSLIGIVAFTALGVAPVAIAFAVVAVTAVVDIAVIQRRRHRGEPG